MASPKRRRVLAAGIAAVIGFGVGVVTNAGGPARDLAASTGPYVANWTGAYMGAADAIRAAADLSDGFVAVATSVTPAVVRIVATRPAAGASAAPSPLDFFGPPTPDRA